MLAKLRARMSYANVVSTLALALAVGGGSAYAATKIGSASPSKARSRYRSMRSGMESDAFRACVVKGVSRGGRRLTASWSSPRGSKTTSRIDCVTTL